MNDERVQGAPHDACELSRIEVSFALPIYLTQEKQRELIGLIESIVKEPWNQLEEGVHWVSGIGSRPSFSKADAVFLGRPVDPDAPESGEPTFDDAILSIDTCAREFVSERERERVMKRRAQDAVKP